MFEQSYSCVRGVSGRALDSVQVRALSDAIMLYKGDLLEGCYQDWCLFDRERLRNEYLAVLDKLTEYSEAHAQYEAAVNYCVLALRSDLAHECTHRRLMRVYFLGGGSHSSPSANCICQAKREPLDRRKGNHF